MAERPIIFTGASVRAILEERKSQTRRVVKGKYDGYVGPRCPYGKPGDQLWVRETMTYWERPSPKDSDLTPRSNESHRPADGKRYQRWMNRVMPAELSGEDFLVYTADGAKRSLGEWTHPHPIYEHCVGRFDKTVPSIFMPRWASRLTLRITKVRVERLQEISDYDCELEGSGHVMPHTAREMYQQLWESINGKRSWAANPWVWVIDFWRVEPQARAA